MKHVLFCLSMLCTVLANAQDSEAKLLKDKSTGTGVYLKHTAEEDSVMWSGDNKDNLAEGLGTLKAYKKGKESFTYLGVMSKGKFNGDGRLLFTDNLKLVGNFRDGEFLNLKEKYLQKLTKNVLNGTTDRLNFYVGDNNEKNLFYYSLVPEGQVNGVVVLLPGTWETTEHAISSTQSICETAYDNQLAVIVPSINQHLVMNENILEFLNSVFRDAIDKYKLPKEQFVIGGWSMGGLFSLRYAEIANQESRKTYVSPRAVFSCDGPVDLENVYKNFQKKAARFPKQNEPKYGIATMNASLGGAPDVYHKNYLMHSAFSLSEEDGGNAKHLLRVPLRIYNDVDVNWWISNRKVDMYDLNALDQSAMVVLLNDKGNDKAEFINAFGKGYRIEGNRHPHSWSIIDGPECISWIKGILKSVN